MITVVFTRNNARIIHGDAGKKYHGHSCVVVNPDLSVVKNVPPHFWKLSKGKIVPMNGVEKAIRNLEIERDGIENMIDLEFKKKSHVSAIIWGVVVLLAAIYLLRK